MNELIKRLADQSWTPVYKTNPYSGGELFFKGNEFNQGTFAELLIKECRTLMVDNINNQLTEDGLHRAFNEHFGVE